VNRTSILVLLVGVDLTVLGILVAWYLASYQPRGGSLSGMMGQMMGSGSTNGMTLAMPGGVWVAVISLLAIAVVGIAGLGYFMAFPEIRSGPVPRPKEPIIQQKGGSETSWAVLLRTSKPEEKKVLEVLAAHEGSYLQKFVVKEAGLSKLKTHRIVSRLAERGIISVEKSGNTNQLSLATWLQGDALKPAAPA